MTVMAMPSHVTVRLVHVNVLPAGSPETTVRGNLSAERNLASYADVLLARHAISSMGRKIASRAKRTSA